MLLANHELVYPNPIGFWLAYFLPFTVYKLLQQPKAPFIKISLEQVTVITHPFVKEQLI